MKAVTSVRLIDAPRALKIAQRYCVEAFIARPPFWSKQSEWRIVCIPYSTYDRARVSDEIERAIRRALTPARAGNNKEQAR